MTSQCISEPPPFMGEGGWGFKSVRFPRKIKSGVDHVCLSGL
jgi:hypothetical protein